MELRENSYVRYGANGICRYVGVQAMSGSKNKNEKYHILKPVAESQTTVFVPVDNETLLAKISPVLSREEIDSLILFAAGSDILWDTDRNARNREFTEIIKAGEQKELLLLVRCIYLKKQELIAAGKKLSMSDEAILKRAEKLLQSEFAFILGIPETQVGEYIRQHMGIE